MKLDQALIATLIYHGIFDYPLQIQELHRYLIGKKASSEYVRKAVANLIRAKAIGEKRNYLYLKSKKLIVKIRLKRKKYSAKKLQRAKFYASILKVVPTIKLVAISGALAMENSHKDDDVDLVIVAGENTLWTTRFFATLVLWPYRRRPQEKKVSDKACLNLFLDKSALKLKEQNIYTAHETAQMKLLWERGGTYTKLIRSNKWIFTYLPNWHPDVKGPAIKVKRKEENAFVLSHLALVIESLFKNFQLAYMHSKITREKIGGHQLFFHPKETQEIVLKKYQKSLMKLKI